MINVTEVNKEWNAIRLRDKWDKNKPSGFPKSDKESELVAYAEQNN